MAREKGACPGRPEGRADKGAGRCERVLRVRVVGAALGRGGAWEWESSGSMEEWEW